MYCVRVVCFDWCHNKCTYYGIGEGSLIGFVLRDPSKQDKPFLLFKEVVFLRQISDLNCICVLHMHACMRECTYMYPCMQS